VHFDGNGYLFAGSSSDYTFGTGDFTIEGYFYFDSSTTSPNDGLWQISGTSGGLQQANSTLSCNYETSGGKTRQLFMGSAGGWRQNGSDNEFSPFMWNHVAEVRSSGVISVYINGKLSQSWSDTTDYTFTDCVVGAYYSTSYRWNGYVSNFRVLKGTALYTSRFTPPTRTLTDVTNTKLLCCQSNTQPGAAAVSPNVSGSLNTGTQWSSMCSGTEYSSTYSYAKAFDNSTSTVSFASNGNTITFTPIGGITNSGNILVTFDNGSVTDGGGSADFQINGSSVKSFFQTAITAAGGGSGSSRVATITGIGNITSMSWSRIADNDLFGVRKIVVDGVTLIDPLSPEQSGVTATTFNPFTDDINAIRGQETGYATLNPLLKGANTTLSDGNLTVSSSGTTFDGFATGTILIPKTGKWFVEFTAGTLPSSTYYGMYNTRTWNPNGFSGTGFFALQADTGNKYKSAGQSTYGSAVSVGDVVGVMYDADNNTLGFMNNGVNYGVAFDSSDGIDYTDDHRVWWNTNGSTSVAHTINFGQKPFRFAPPDGFQPLNAANTRPVKVISRPDQYVGIVTYTGNGGSSQSFSGLNFGEKPDLVWVKGRSYSISSLWYDSVRGVGANKNLITNGANAEGNAQADSTYGYVSSLDDNGFSIVGGSDVNNGYVNKSSATYVAWAWKAGGDAYTYNKDYAGGSSASDIGVSATTLTLTGASINTTSKFGIYTYTGSGSGGATITHGLGGTPAFVVYKKRTGSSSWQIYHQSLGGTKYMNWDEDTNAYTSDSTRFGGTDPTESIISLGTHANGAETVVLYAWCDVPGLQKFGSYTGNSSADGMYIELGFRPAILIIKNTTDDSKYWYIYDTTRNTHNPINTVLAVNRADSTITTGNLVDIVSNGFKLRSDLTFTNASSKTYIYMAWAEAPSVDLYGGGANAR
jgi:hypothetical protein